ncbi:hypothetical protein BDV93DRAFT_194356 [Ceratobasidium sp. AG-I]|nr:hypothetical protein BDV93DRAFT_194356 [Ceratobasidium sp. AG-I]
MISYSEMPPKMPPKVKLDYELPCIMKSVQSGWQATFQASATVGALFAGTEAQLLSLVKSAFPDVIDPTSNGAKCLVSFTYLAFFFSISTTVCSLILIDKIGELDLRASTRNEELKNLTDTPLEEEVNKILKRFGVSHLYPFMLWYWLCMLVLACLCVVGQILVYVSLTETTSVKAVVYCSIGFVVFPLFAFAG